MRFSHHRTPPIHRSPTARRERGAALIELSIVVGVLALLLFGIITFGVTMSFRQTLSQAANEAARAAAVAPTDLAVGRARTAVDRVMAGEGTGCDDGRGLRCTFVVTPCTDDPTSTCLAIRLTYDLKGRPLVGSVVGIEQTLPDQLVANAVVEVQR